MTPTPKHQEIAGELYTLLSAYVKANALGKVYIAPVDILVEMAAYSRFGVQEYWVVDPEKQGIEVHTRGSKGCSLPDRFLQRRRWKALFFPAFSFA